jgi:hypothetical protein
MTTPKTKPARCAKAAIEPPRRKRAARRTIGPKPTPAHEKTTVVDGAAATAIKTPGGKLGIVVGLMRRPEGATVSQMSTATNWQAHSVRGALAGSLKKKHGLSISSEVGEGGRVYRIRAEQPA